MFENTNLFAILGPAVLLVAVSALILRARMNRQSDATQKALAMFKLMTVATGFLLVFLWMLLPTAAVLSSFGFPKATADIQSPERLLDYLQQYNRALVRTTEVLHWFLFVFLWWFVASCYAVMKGLGSARDARASVLELHVRPRQ